MVTWPGTISAQTDNVLRSEANRNLLLEEPHTALYFLNRITQHTPADELLPLEARLLRDPSFTVDVSSVTHAETKRSAYFLYLIALSEFQHRNAAGTLATLKRAYQSSDHSLMGKIEFLKGKAWLDVNQPDSSLLHLKRALKIFKSDSLNSYIQIAKVHNNLGRAYGSKEMATEAIVQYTAALHILSNSPLEKWNDLGKIHNNLATVYDSEGDYALAQQHYLEAIIIKENHSTDSLNRAITYSNVASFYSDYANYLKSQQYYEKTLPLIDSMRTTSYPLLGDYYNNYGVLMMAMREFTTGIHAFRKSLHLYKKSNAVPRQMIRPALNLASCLISNSEQDQARVVLDAQDSIIQTLPAANFDRANYWIVRGNLELEQSSAIAEKNFLTAKQILEALPRIPERKYIEVLLSLGSVPARLNLPTQAIPYYRQALHRIENFYPDKEKLVTVYNCLGKAFAAQGESDSASYYFRNALRENVLKSETSQPLFVSTFELITTHYNLVSVGYSEYTKSNQIESLLGTLPSVEGGMQLIRLERDRMSSEHDKIGLGVSVADFYDLSVKIYHELFTLTGKAEYYESMLLAVERSRQQVMMASLRIDNIKAFAGVTNRLMNHEQQVNYTIRHLTAQLSDELSLGEDATGELVQEYDQALAATRQQFQTLTDSLKNNLPDYYNLKYNTTLAGATAIENDVLAGHPQKALVQYFVADSTLFIIVQHSQRKAVMQIPYSGIAKHVTALRNHIQYKLPGWQTPASWLYDRLIKPVDSVLAGLRPSIRELIIIPDRELVYLPFETLVPNATAQTLIERMEITYAFSSTLLWQKATDRSQKTDQHAFIGFAPTFEQNGTPAQYPVRAGGELVSFTPLPSTPLEVKQITALLNKKGIATQTFEGDQASEASFKFTSLSKYRYVHLATHGFVNMEDPDRSGLAFSKVDAGEDGILFSGEVYGVRLNAELVCLSACETGLGKIYRGEGLIGLSRGFLYAGARNLVVSLWSVDDKSTSEWMTEFYTTLAKGERNAVAVRKAKLALLKSKKYSHPYFWAPFILIGG